jgi:CubicO group peptidase (beta-lactamase class C family)
MCSFRSFVNVGLHWITVLSLAFVATADDVEPQLRDYMAAAAKNDGFSGAVLVARGGTPLLREAYGKANIELEVPNTAQTKFRLGSITKQFTAMAVLILSEQGKLNLEDPISKHLEYTPLAWEKVTIRHLLMHTSGVPSYTSFPQMMSRTVRLTAPLDDVIATFRDKELEFAPGEKFTYSNSGYVLLGKIIERAARQDYEAFMRENIFQPLEMNDSGYDHNTEILPRRAAGYVKTPLGLSNAPYIDMTWPHAAGALYSTVDDLSRWDQALAAGKLISAESYQALFTPGKGDYALGWFVRDRGGRLEVGHGGGIHGFSTSILRYPADKLCVVVLSNIIPSRCEKIGHDLADIVQGPPQGK